MGRILTSGPAEEPITTEEAKLHLRETESSQDALILALVQSAREHIEHETGRALIKQSWTLTLDAFPCERYIRLPLPPLISVGSVNYIDSNGASQVMSTSKYVVDLSSKPFGKIDLAYGASWPTTRYQPNAVSVAFTCGFGDDKSAVPASIKAALKLHLSHLYENREAISVGESVTELPMAYNSLLWPWRVMEVG